MTTFQNSINMPMAGNELPLLGKKFLKNFSPFENKSTTAFSEKNIIFLAIEF